ncbi:MAG: phage antirepressor KilAC domain-containing protein [Gloeotrichia echinulata CP02]|jgi:anti-repressor protein
MTNLNFTIQSQIKSTVQSDKEFSVNFNDAWQWLDYSKKSNAKASFLNCGFIENVDYSSLLVNQQREVGATRVEEIYLTKDCLKSWAMMSNTARGKEVRAYFIKCEAELKAIKAAPQLPSDYLSALKALVSAEEAKLIAESKVLDMAPKVELYNTICESGQNITMGELAKVIGIKGLGRNNLFQFLKNQGILQFNNIPYQKYMNKGHFVCIQAERNRRVYTVTLATPSGIEFVIDLLKKNGYLIPSKAA